MKSEYQFNSAQELTPEIIQAIKLAFGDKPIRMTIETPTQTSNKTSEQTGKYSKELTDTVLDLIFDQLSKKK